MALIDITHHILGIYPGDPASWRSAEYQQDWGLERMRADQAYAAECTLVRDTIGRLPGAHWTTFLDGWTG